MFSKLCSIVFTTLQLNFNSKQQGGHLLK